MLMYHLITGHYDMKVAYSLFVFVQANASPGSLLIVVSRLYYCPFFHPVLLVLTFLLILLFLLVVF